jgi:1-acyl-sn-glycerol-3-phosphate acyltransferase
MDAHIRAGGNIIVFPEGTRSRDGAVGELHKGAFKIAKYCRAPIKVLKVRNTDKLLMPGSFLFNTCSDNTIGLTLIAELIPEYASESFSIRNLIAQVHAFLRGDTEHKNG